MYPHHQAPEGGARWRLSGCPRPRLTASWCKRGRPHSSSSQVTTAPGAGVHKVLGPVCSGWGSGSWRADQLPCPRRGGRGSHIFILPWAPHSLQPGLHPRCSLRLSSRVPAGQTAGRRVPGPEPSSVCPAGMPSTDGSGPDSGDDGGCAWKQSLSDTLYTLFRSDPPCCPGEHHRAAQGAELRRGRKWVGLRLIHHLLPPSLRVPLSTALRQAPRCGRETQQWTEYTGIPALLALSRQLRRQTGRGQGPEEKKLRKG